MSGTDEEIMEEVRRRWMMKSTGADLAMSMADAIIIVFI